MSQTYIGIDYGSIAGSNRNVETGIHYGVISLNSLASWIYDDVESDYGKPACPTCGREVVASDDIPTREAYFQDHGEYVTDQDWHDGKDYMCLDCEECYWSDSCFPDEPVSQDFTPGNKEYKTEYSESLNALFVTDAPYYTYARYCSPCCPGALDLDNAIEPETAVTYQHTDSASTLVATDAPKGYCFGHEYFEDHQTGKATGAPYRVFRVADDTEVLAETETGQETSK